MNLWSLLAVAVAGAACGVVNSIAGGGSLILFPVLLLTGMSPLAANVTNSVSTWAGYAGGVGGFRSEIRAQRSMMPRFVAATLAGSTLGCILLLVTPGEAFDVIVPWLVLGATALTALQPVVRKRLSDRSALTNQPNAAAVVAVFLATIYGGYFGGGLGVMVLAVLGLTVRDTLRNLNASKALISLVDASVSVAVFGLFGPVQWGYVAVAAPTTLVGGYAGAAIARRIDERLLRVCVVLVGVTVSGYLFWRSF
ncbi:MAG: sulfite exporter TauE/SafE family protein [Actinomycetota bacterium]|nr:sulfite exporter TauE/SafE family protein [Actinomycetota bacterium]